MKGPDDAKVAHTADQHQ